MNSLQEFKKERVQSQIEKNSLDLLIASLPENIYYLSGFDNIGQQILSKTQAYLSYDPGTDCKTIITSVSDIPTLIEGADVDEILAVGGFQFSYNEKETPFRKKLENVTSRRFPSAAEALKNANVIA